MQTVSSRGPITWRMETLQALSEEDRRTFILAVRYELARQRETKYRQPNYRVFFERQDFRRVVTDKKFAGDTRTRTQLVSDYKKFQQFAGVRKWLENAGWKISLEQLGWQGYLKYLFQEFAESIPTPLQLKNPVLLRRYLASTETRKVKPVRTAKVLAAIYKRVIRPEYL